MPCSSHAARKGKAKQDMKARISCVRSSSCACRVVEEVESVFFQPCGLRGREGPGDVPDELSWSSGSSSMVAKAEGETGSSGTIDCAAWYHSLMRFSLSVLSE